MNDVIEVSGIDVLVLGGGATGINAARRAKDKGAKKVVIVDKGFAGKSGQGAFGAGALWVYDPKVDDPTDSLRRVVRGIGWLAQQETILQFMERHWEVIQEWENLGVDFLKTPTGKYVRLPGRGKTPMMFFKGPQLMDILMKVSKKKGVEHVNRVMMMDLLTEDGRVVGATGFNIRTGDFHVFKAKATIMATGSTWYKGRCPGARDSTGDGYVAAFRAGAVLGGAEIGGPSNMFSAKYDIGPGMNRYMGEGGRLLNAKGDRFMPHYAPHLAEISGLRLLNSAMAIETKLGNSPFYVDMRHLTPEQVNRMKEVLPIAMRLWEKVGVVKGDAFVTPIEWIPAGPMGRLGLVVDNNFMSTLTGLFVGGEATAYQTDLEGIIQAGTHGVIAAENAIKYIKDVPGDVTLDSEQIEESRKRTFEYLGRKNGIDPHHVLLAMQEAIMPYDVMYLRHKERMQKALDEVIRLRDTEAPMMYAHDPHDLKIANEVRNLLFVAEGQLRSCMFRTESRTVLREDYPYQDNVNWLKWIDLKNDKGEIKLSTRDVPIDKYPQKAERDRVLAYIWQQAQDLGKVKISEEGKVEWVSER